MTDARPAAPDPARWRGPHQHGGRAGSCSASLYRVRGRRSQPGAADRAGGLRRQPRRLPRRPDAAGPRARARRSSWSSARCSGACWAGSSTWIGQIPVTRNSGDRSALHGGRGGPAAPGERSGIFPEGTRGRGDVAAVQQGAAWLAQQGGRRSCRWRSSAPGARARRRARCRGRGSRMVVEFGEPMRPRARPRADRPAAAGRGHRAGARGPGRRTSGNPRSGTGCSSPRTTAAGPRPRAEPAVLTRPQMCATMVGGPAATLTATDPHERRKETPVSENLTDDSTVERALRVGLEEYDLSEEDRSLLDGEYDEDGYAVADGPAARRSPSSAAPTSASRPWSTASSAAARPSSRTCPASPATASPTTPSGPAAGSPSSTPAAGSTTRPGIAPARRRAGRGRRRARRRRDVRRRRHRRRHRRRRGRRQAAAPRPASRSSSSPTRSTTSAARPTPPRCGPSASASRTRSPRCTAAAPATCSTPSSTCCPALRRRRRLPARRPAPGRPGRPPQRRQVLACSTSSPARTGSSSTTSPAPPATRSTSSSSSAARPGASSTPPASAAASTRPAAPTTTPRCAPRPRWRRPRSPSS